MVQEAVRRYHSGQGEVNEGVMARVMIGRRICCLFNRQVNDDLTQITLLFTLHTDKQISGTIHLWTNWDNPL